MARSRKPPSNNNNKVDNDAADDASSSSSSDEDNHHDAAAAAASAAKSKKRQAIDFNILEREMELADYDKTETGQRLKRVRRKEQKRRTIKRKKLEREEAHEFEMTVTDNEKRLRGSKAAVQEDLIEASQVVFEAAPEEDEAAADDQDEQEDVEEGEADEDDEGAENDDNEKEGEASKSKISSAKKPAKKKQQTSTRKLYRLKNFQSHRLAQRHGEAMGAHARGDHKGAIEQLKAIAKLAPSAPQVYSSLGLVYEDMLKVSQKRREEKVEAGEDITGTSSSQAAAASSGSDEEKISDPYLIEQLQLAQKAYGSYHIAAVLCKKDFNLWVRSADMGLTIGDLHTTVMALPETSSTLRDYHKKERERWLAEALRDYVMADNLKPPGIDVPAKLAATHIELGNLSEALTILTDLKNRYSASKGSRNEFQDSYKGWLLYADLMLRFGHEITQWGQGIQTNKNYMFRRWLRKWYRTFDWQERRLQALSMAFRAAAGSKCTSNYMTWTKERAASKPSSSPPRPKEAPHNNTKEPASSGNAGNDPKSVSFGSEQPSEEKETERGNEQFEEEKRLLLEKNAAELAAFDRTTRDMELPDNSEAGQKRQADREALLKQQRSDVVDLVGDHHHQVSSQSQIDNDDEINTGDDASTSISASCPTVINIAAELMKHLHAMNLYEGGKLVGEAVASYLKERAALRDKRVSRRKRLDNYHANARNSLMCMDDFNEVRTSTRHE